MKRRKLILLFLLALPAAVWSQTLNNAQLNPLAMPNADQKLVRNWDDQWVVSYHVIDSINSFFSCTDYSDFYLSSSMPASPSFFSVMIPSDYSVKDMEIVDNYVFFCGSKKTGTFPGPYVYNGFVGYFDLYTFISGTFDPTIIDVGCVLSIEKMAAYNTPAGYNIAAVGISSNVPAPPHFLHHNSTILEISDVIGAPSCNYAIIDGNLVSNETIEDVVYTGAYVAFVGVVKSSSTRLYHVRVMDNPASLPASTSGNYIHIFSSSPSYAEVNGRPLPAVIDKNNLALTYVYHDFTYNTDETRLRIIDLSTTVPTNINSQHIPKDQKEEPVGMIYSSSNDTLVLLQNFKHLIDNLPQFAFLKPFSTSSYNADLFYPSSGETYNSLDLYNGNSFVSVGNDNNTYLQVITSPTLPHCLGIDDVKVGELRNDNTVSVFEPLPWQTYPLLSINPFGPNTSDTWRTFCNY